MKQLGKLLPAMLAALPVYLLGFSTGPPIMRTGAAVDGGLTCVACHITYAPPNSDPRGKVTITAVNYTPGQKQMIKVRVEHPDAMRWGFQLTARLESDLTQQAGTFTVVDGSIRVRCAPTGDAPCSGALEFAEHVAASTQLGQSGGGEWMVEWTAPATASGPVVFFAAGNAANGNGNPIGDYIYTTQSRIIAAGGPAGTKPTLTAGGIADAFTYQAGVMTSSGWLAVVGQNLAPSTGDWTPYIQGGKLPTSLRGVSVTIGGKAAAVYYVSPTQINFLAPLDDTVGDAIPVVVTTDAGASNTLMARKQAYVPALYAPFTDASKKQFVTAVALDGTFVGSMLDPRVTRAVRPGETISLFGSGFGATNPPVAIDQLATGAPAVVTPPAITFGQTAVQVLSGNLVQAGLYQFNVTVPDSTPDGDLAVSCVVSGVRSAGNVVISVKR